MRRCRQVLREGGAYSGLGFAVDAAAGRAAGAWAAAAPVAPWLDVGDSSRVVDNDTSLPTDLTGKSERFRSSVPRISTPLVSVFLLLVCFWTQIWFGSWFPYKTRKKSRWRQRRRVELTCCCYRREEIKKTPRNCKAREKSKRESPLPINSS